jgi:hypothetical protein
MIFILLRYGQRRKREEGREIRKEKRTSPIFAVCLTVSLPAEEIDSSVSL